MPAVGELTIAYDHMGSLCIGTVIDAPPPAQQIGGQAVYYMQLQDQLANWQITCVLVEDDSVLAFAPNIRAASVIAAATLSRRQAKR